MKKKTRANFIMVIIICAIVAGGVLGVGYIRGWFDSASDSTAMLTQIRGTVNMERGGVIYPVENDTVLRAGAGLCHRNRVCGRNHGNGFGRDNGFHRGGNC